MDQSIQKALTAASALRTNLLNLSKQLDGLAAKEAEVLSQQSKELEMASKTAETEEVYSSDDEFCAFEESRTKEDGQVAPRQFSAKLTDKLAPAFKSDLLSEYTNTANSLSDLWRTIDPHFAAQVVVPADLPPPNKQSILLPLLNISVSSAEATCQYQANPVFQSTENSTTRDEEQILLAKLVEHETKISTITAEVKHKIDLFTLPTLSQSRQKKLGRLPLKRKFNT